MTRLRKSPTDNDVQRIAEVLHRNYGRGIKDQTTFNKAFSSYFSDNITSGIEGLRGGVFKELQQRSSHIEKGSIFEDAKGKDYERDSKRTAKRTVTTKKQYIKLGARTVDLVGYDTKKAGDRLSKKGGAFPFAGSSRGKSVFAREVLVTIKGKNIIKFRDPRGRFVKRL